MSKPHKNLVKYINSAGSHGRSHKKTDFEVSLPFYLFVFLIAACFTVSRFEACAKIELLELSVVQRIPTVILTSYSNSNRSSNSNSNRGFLPIGITCFDTLTFE